MKHLFFTIVVAIVLILTSGALFLKVHDVGREQGKAQVKDLNKEPVPVEESTDVQVRAPLSISQEYDQDINKRDREQMELDMMVSQQDLDSTNAVVCNIDVYLSTQSGIYEATYGPRRDGRWADSISTELDHKILNVKIVAYKIRWFNGNWSSWFVPGVNDLYKKTYEPLRRYWACFYDHTHKFIYIVY